MPRRRPSDAPKASSCSNLAALPAIGTDAQHDAAYRELFDEKVCRRCLYVDGNRQPVPAGCREGMAAAARAMHASRHAPARQKAGAPGPVVGCLMRDAACWLEMSEQLRRHKEGS